VVAITAVFAVGILNGQSHSIRAGSLIDGRGKVSRDVRIEVVAGKIAAIGPSDGKEEFQLTKQTLMPGWIGACLGVGAQEDRVEAASKAFGVLKAGFTTAVSNYQYDETLFSGPRIVTGTDCETAERFQARITAGGAFDLGDFEKVTYWAAVALGIQGRVGSVAEGMAADLIAVDGNPLEDFSALQRIVFVMKGGRVYVEPPPARRRLQLRLR
jgi:imidazolonepropionase-like amidohydrolase